MPNVKILLDWQLIRYVNQHTSSCAMKNNFCYNDTTATCGFYSLHVCGSVSMGKTAALCHRLLQESDLMKLRETPTKSHLSINAVFSEGHRVAPLGSPPHPAGAYPLWLKCMSQVADIRITKARRRQIGDGRVSQVLPQLNPADTAGRLEESKVIMGNWLSHLKHLAGSYPPVSLLILLTGRLLWWSWMGREAESFWRLWKAHLRKCEELWLVSGHDERGGIQLCQLTHTPSPSLSPTHISWSTPGPRVSFHQLSLST